MALTKQEIEEQIAHEKELIRELARRKRILETQAARKGNNVPPEVLTEISDLTDDIRIHEEQVVRLEALPVTEKQLRVLFVEDVEHYAEQYLKVLQALLGLTT